MHVIDLEWINLAAIVLLLIPVFILANRLGIGINKQMAIGVVRLFAQLFLIGLYLGYLFRFDNVFVNIAYLLIMCSVACYTAIKQSPVKLNFAMGPVLLSVAMSFLLYLVMFNYLLLGIGKMFGAQYIIPMGGMMLGNSLKAIVIALNNFFNNAQEKENQYLQRIGFGATPAEASLPFVRNAVKAAIKPTLAMVATMGLVSMPGMMTGQLLAGALPMLAIKYQIAIVLGILANSFLNIYTLIMVVRRNAFDEWGILRKEIYK